MKYAKCRYCGAFIIKGTDGGCGYKNESVRNAFRAIWQQYGRALAHEVQR